jgi:Ni/Co efflux regulator RcnB
MRGQRIPNNYRLQVVPQSYYASVPPPPPGYQYGYYDGYVVAYNPTTRIIADVLDLVTAATVR